MSSIWSLPKTQAVAVQDSAVDFPTKTRFHVALNVKQVTPLLDFYRALFGCEAHTQREGYIKFDLREPPLIISLNEVPKNARGHGRFGIEFKSGERVNALLARLDRAQLSWVYAAASTPDAPDLVVCDPEGNAWRVFVACPSAH